MALPDASTVESYAQATLAVLGSVYTLFSIIGAVAPNTRVGKFCRTVAADIKGLLPTSNAPPPKP